MRTTILLALIALTGCTSPCVQLCDLAHETITASPPDYDIGSWTCYDLGTFPAYTFRECTSWNDWRDSCADVTELKLAWMDDEDRGPIEELCQGQLDALRSIEGGRADNPTSLF
jgi:hypothetical protein